MLINYSEQNNDVPIEIRVCVKTKIITIHSLLLYQLSPRNLQLKLTISCNTFNLNIKSLNR